MRKIICFFSFLVVLCLPFFIVGCSDGKKNNENGTTSESTQTTQTPQQIQLEPPVANWQNNLICWNKIDNAIGYIVKVNEEEFSVTNNSYDLTISNSPKTYSIYVKALGDNNNFKSSVYSDELLLNSQYLTTPYISYVSGDTTFRVSEDRNSGVIDVSINKNTDYLKFFVNDNEYIVEDADEITILSSMCKSGYNTIKIQACSYNKLFLDSDFLVDDVYKESPPSNVRISNGKIIWGLNIPYDHSHYDYLGYGNIRVPVICFGLYNTLNSDPVYIDVYRTKPLDTYSLDYVVDYDLMQYHCLSRLQTDLSKDMSNGTNYDKLEIIVYTNGGPTHTLNIDIEGITKKVEFSVSADAHIKKVTYRLYNSKHPEFLNTITTINEHFIDYSNS